jgi:hypothetical protein
MGIEHPFYRSLSVAMIQCHRLCAIWFRRFNYGKHHEREKMKIANAAVLAACFSALIAACGGGGGDAGGDGGSSGSTSGSSSGASSGSSSGSSSGASSSLCSGTSWLTPSYDVYSGASGTSTAQPATYYGANLSANNQCVSIDNTLQVTSTDNFANNIAWFDPIGTPLSGIGAVRFDQRLLLTCASGSSAIKHLAVQSNNGAALISSTMAPAIVGNAFTFQSLECNSAGSAILSGRLTAQFGYDKSLILTNTQSGAPANLTTTEVNSLFSSSGYTWSDGSKTYFKLYVVPAGALAKNVIVNTDQYVNGTYKVYVFIQP